MYLQNEHEIVNCDAGFCGLFQEEAELLWNMDNDYLKEVHIVPVRPCISTMKGTYLVLGCPDAICARRIAMMTWIFVFRVELKSLSIEISIGYSQSRDGDPRSWFLSRLTKFLVVERMPLVDFNVKFTYIPVRGNTAEIQILA